MKTSLDYIITIPNSTDTLCNLVGTQTLQNKTIDLCKLGVSNIIKTNNNNNLQFVDVSDSIVNLNSNQTLSNKSLSNTTILNNTIKGATGGVITFLDTNDTIVNLSSNQSLSNKAISNLTITDDFIKNSLGRIINLPMSNSMDTLVNENNSQTLTNKTLTNCLANTQLITDNSTKIATTGYVNNILTQPNTYVSTSFMSQTSPYTISSSYTDIASITIPVIATYEILCNLSFVTNQKISIRLYNNTTSQIIPNTTCCIQDMANVTGNIETSISRVYIIENIPANTVIKLQAIQNSGTSTMYNDDVFGKTSLSYKLLGLTNNVISPISWVSISTSNNTTNIISATPSTYQKIYSLGTTQPILPTNSYLDYSYLINGKTLKINYSLFYSNRTGGGDGSKMYIWPLPDGCVIDTSKVSVYTGFTTSMDFTDTTSFFEAFEKSNSLGYFWCNQGKATYRLVGDVLGFYKTDHPYHLKGVYLSVNDGSNRNIVSSGWFPLTGTGGLGVNNNTYKFIAEIPIL
jgi:hypothetical protein